MPDNIYPFETEPRRKFDLVWFADIKPALVAHDFVENLLGDNQFSVVYGESNCGKTFFALDLALHLAQGQKWFGKEMRQTGVIYVAMEGGHGIRNRISAFKQHHGLDDAALSLAVIPQQVSLLRNQSDTQGLLDAVAGAAQQIEGPIGLVIFDTLSRALAGGDENSSEDMGDLVRNADYIRKMTGAHVMFIHHSGKDTARGARGHSLVRAATDTEIEVTRDPDSGTSTAEVRKQRDLATDGRMSFKLISVEVGRTPRDKPVKSCIVEHLDVPAEPRRKIKTEALKDRSKLLLSTLNNLLIENGIIPPQSQNIPANTKCLKASILRSTFFSRSIAEAKSAAQRQAFGRAMAELQAHGLVAVWEGWIWKAKRNG